MAQPRVVYRLRYRSRSADGAPWLLYRFRRVVGGAVTRKHAISSARNVARGEWEEGYYPSRAPRRRWSQLVVHNKNGRIAFEATYPRSSDPRRHRG
jgi:hypothetical protein